MISSIAKRLLPQFSPRSFLVFAFDLVALGHTLTKDDRHHLPYVVKKESPATRVLVLHASGKHPQVDLAIDSRDGERSVLNAVAALLTAREPGRTSEVMVAAVA